MKFEKMCIWFSNTEMALGIANCQECNTKKWNLKIMSENLEMNAKKFVTAVQVIGKYRCFQHLLWTGTGASSVQLGGRCEGIHKTPA